jgi:two-component system nitrogen regulation sensor histidine kinase GlnL
MPPAPAATKLPLSNDALLDHLNVAVALLDPNLHFIRANSAFCELFDIGASKLRGMALEAFGPSAEVLCTLAGRARADRSVVTRRGQQIVTGTGRALRADIVASALPEAGVLLEIHSLLPEAAVSPSPLSETLRGLAHEVKNPLAGLRGAAQLLKRRLAEPELTRLAQLIIDEADRLGALTDRLLSPGGKSQLADVNLHEVAERARALIAAEAAPELKLERDYDPSLPTIFGDADRLQQLLLNLMLNALQANAKTILVRTRAEHAARLGVQPVRLALRLDVIDDGDGVPEALRDSLFLPLVSGHSGSGLGLALAQEIAHEHGGQLAYTGHAGNTMFTLILPLERAHG